MDTSAPNERKIVSVLFCDIAGSYTFLYESDPEQGKLIIDRAVAEMTSVIERFGGVVNQVQGDGVMSLFGAPLAVEDHAQRACAAAMELVATFKRKNSDGSWPNASPIEIRIGVSTGEAVVGVQSVKLPLGGEGYEYFATGAVSHLAGRLQKLAGSFEIVVSDETAAAMGDAAKTEALADRSVHELIKGHAKPLCLTELAQPAASVSGGESQFVGRTTEMAGLQQSLAASLQGKRFQAVAVTGDPGLGKSRLIREFLNSEDARDCKQFVGSANSVEKNIPFAMLRRVLSEWLGINEYSTDETRLSRLQQSCEFIDKDDWRLRESLRDVISLPTVDVRWRKLEPDIRREETYRSLQTLFVWWGKQQPTIVWIDDLHWADPISRQLIETLASEPLDSPVLLLLTSREKPRIQATPGYRVYPLSPLAKDESRQLLDTFAVTTSMAPASIDNLLERFAGVPLFIEQVAYAEPGNVTTEGVSEQGFGVSPAIRSLIGARIDQLSPAVKRVLTTASVAGTRFDLACLTQLFSTDEVDLEAALDSLIQGGFIESASSFQEYQFTHALYQEVAYLGILRSRLLQLHATYLDYFKRIAGVRSDSRLDGQINYHAWHGHQWNDVARHSAGAARDAMDSGAYSEAIHFLEQGLHAHDKIVEADEDVAPETEKARAELLLELSRACIPVGDFERSYQALYDCQAISRKLGDNHLYCESYAYQTALLCVQRDSATALASGEEAVRVAEETASDRLLFGCKVYWAQALFFHGEFESVCEILQSLVDRGVVDRYPLDRIGNTSPVSIDCYGILGMSYAQLGEFDQAEHYGQLAAEVADRTGKSFDRGLAYFYLTYILVHRCRMQEAEVSLKEVVDVIDAGGVQFLGPWVGGLLGFIYASQGELQRAEDLVQRSIADSRRMSLSIFEVYALVSLAFVQMKKGDTSQCNETLDLAEDLAKKGQFKSVQMWILRSRGGLAMATGNIDEAVDYLLRAITAAEALGMLPDAAHCHAMIASLSTAGTTDNKFADPDSVTKATAAAVGKTSLKKTQDPGVTEGDAQGSAAAASDTGFYQHHQIVATKLYKQMSMPV